MSVDRLGGVEFEGIRQLRRDLKRLGGPELQKAFRERMKAAVGVVVDDARSRAPAQSGKLRESITAFAAGSKFGVQGGKARVPYYGWIDFGGMNPPPNRPAGKRGTRQRTFYRQGRILYPAIEAHIDDVRRAAESALDETIERSGL